MFVFALKCKWCEVLHLIIYLAHSIIWHAKACFCWECEEWKDVLYINLEKVLQAHAYVTRQGLQEELIWLSTVLYSVRLQNSFIKTHFLSLPSPPTQLENINELLCKVQMSRICLRYKYKMSTLKRVLAAKKYGFYFFSIFRLTRLAWLKVSFNSFQKWMISIFCHFQSLMGLISAFLLFLSSKSLYSTSFYSTWRCSIAAWRCDRSCCILTQYSHTVSLCIIWD